MSDQTETKIDKQKIAETYNNLTHVFKAIGDEAEFILKDKINETGIKIHLIESRVKTLTSIFDKAHRKELIDPLTELNDITGVRVVCLFRSDIERITKLIREHFHVVNIDDKVNSEADTFGYMSVHCVVRIKREFTGPRYNKIKDRNFEIQIRTISMHAWAAISHHLDYKGEWDVPSSLKKALNALSGLFYVADDEFERFFEEREKFRTKVSTKSPESTDIDLDALSNFLKKAFPDRNHAPDNVISDVIKEIKEAGFSNLLQLQKHIENATVAVKEYELTEGNQERPQFFADVGALRLSLLLSSEKYLQIRSKRPIRESTLNKIRKHRKFLKNGTMD